MKTRGAEKLRTLGAPKKLCNVWRASFQVMYGATVVLVLLHVTREKGLKAHGETSSSIFNYRKFVLHYGLGRTLFELVINPL